MKNLEKLSGVKTLDKKQQQTIKGGATRPCYVECHPDASCSGFNCYFKE